jgi:hypothetical protein
MWIVEDRGGLENAIDQHTRVIHVRTGATPAYGATPVWLTVRRGKFACAHCGRCSTPLVAMSQSCAHVKAVRRAWDAGRISEKAP